MDKLSSSRRSWLLKQVIGISLLIAPHTIRNEVKGTIAKHAVDRVPAWLQSGLGNLTKHAAAAAAAEDDDDDDDDEIKTLCVWIGEDLLT